MKKQEELKHFVKDKFFRNKAIVDFALSVYNTLDVLDQPVCPHCEQVGLWDKGGMYCHKCGHTTSDSLLTMAEYCEQELMKRGRK